MRGRSVMAQPGYLWAMDKTMRIGFDVSPLTHNHPPGVRRATAELVAALERRGQLEVCRLTPQPGANLRRWRQIELPRSVAHLGLAGIHSPVSAFPLAGPGLRVQTVHELPWKHGVSENADLGHRCWASLAGRLAAAVCVPTELVARDLGRPLAKNGGRLHVCPWAAADPFTAHAPQGTFDEAQLARHHLPDTPFVLAPGAVRAKKNLAATLAGMAELKRRGEDRLQLVVTGEETASLRRDLGLASRLGVAGEVSTLGHVTDLELAALMRLAAAVVVLSTSEGFALPALEAAACGSPVVASLGGAAAEVLGPLAITVEPASGAAVADGLKRALADSSKLRPGLVKRAALFSWDKTAATVEDIWQSLI